MYNEFCLRFHKKYTPILNTDDKAVTLNVPLKKNAIINFQTPNWNILQRIISNDRMYITISNWVMLKILFFVLFRHTFMCHKVKTYTSIKRSN